MTIKDILPLIRGGFIDKNGTSYSKEQQMNGLSAFNITFEQKKSTNLQKTLTKYTPLT